MSSPTDDQTPQPLRELNEYFLAAMIGHEYVSDLARELVELEASNAHSRKLLRESADTVFERLPLLTRQASALRRRWSEQELLDPPAAALTVEALDRELADVRPAILMLRERQNHIAAELLDLVRLAR